jgi:hypothetical protein
VPAAIRLGAGELVVRGRTAEGDWERRLRVGMPRPGDGDPAIAALFGRERVADLEARAFGGEDRDAEIERIGLAFQIATRFTPFIAVDETRAVRPAVRHDAVPQELPYGTTAAAFGLRPGADPADVDLEAPFEAEVFGEIDGSRGFRVHASVARELDAGMDDDDFDDLDTADSVAIDPNEGFDDEHFDADSSSLVRVTVREGERPSMLFAEEDERPIVAPEPAVPVTTTGRPGAPDAPPDPKADRRARIARAMKPRGLANVVRRTSVPVPPTPSARPPSAGPMKTVMSGPSEAGRVVKTQFGLHVPVARDASDRLEVLESRSAIPSSLPPALETHEPRAMDRTPVVRRGWLMLLALLAIGALLAALLWWLVV